jgi:diguanylate cyclase (GGDEF)-like protein/PAS domain S-box-containing protein
MISEMFDPAAYTLSLSAFPTFVTASAIILLASTVLLLLLIIGWAIKRYRLIDFTPSFAANEIIATMVDPLIVCDAEGRIRLVNEATRSVLGYSDVELLGKPIQFLTVPGDGASRLQTAFENGPTRDEEMVFLDKDQRPVEVSVSVSYLRDSDNAKVGAVVIGRDIRELKRSEERLSYLANHDPLTNLPNRSLFADRVSEALDYASRHKSRLAVLIVDLDRFKIINETLGQVFGNRLLRVVSDRLSVLLVNERDALARLGGVKFALALTELASAEEGSQAGQNVLNTLARPFDLDGREIFVNASVGISLYPDDGVDAEALLRHAEAAMHHSKEKGGGNVHLYRDDMNVTPIRRLVLEADLHHALERGEFVLCYQPQVDLDTGQIIGMEALIRWNKPGKGPINPAEFIPLAEQSGLITLIGEWGLETACAQNAAWQREGLLPVRMAVNLSARQFRDENLTKTIARILEKSDLGPNYLELELTEGLLMHGDKPTLSRLRDLNGMGVRFCIDDFGTGYSSLGYLKKFPINTLKIDRSFVQNISTDPDSAAITTAIIQMAHCLKLKVIAEGVEKVDQLDFLRSLKCDEIQGFLFSQPLPAQQIAGLLREGRTLEAFPPSRRGDLDVRKVV